MIECGQSVCLSVADKILLSQLSLAALNSCPKIFGTPRYTKTTGMLWAKTKLTRQNSKWMNFSRFIFYASCCSSRCTVQVTLWLLRRHVGSCFALNNFFFFIARLSASHLNFPSLQQQTQWKPFPSHLLSTTGRLVVFGGGGYSMTKPDLVPKC